MPDEDLPLSVDKGLMAQVYDNLFSNAVKYTRRNAEGRKYMAYGRDLLQRLLRPRQGRRQVQRLHHRAPYSPGGRAPYL